MSHHAFRTVTVNNIPSVRQKGSIAYEILTIYRLGKLSQCKFPLSLSNKPYL